MDPRRPLDAEIAGIAACAGSVEQRAQALLEPLRTAVPCRAAWIAMRDPETGRHHPVAQDGDTAALARYFAVPAADEELEAYGENRYRPPMFVGELPVPPEETLARGEYFLPAGFGDGVGVGVFSADGRHLGFLSLLSDDPVLGGPEHAGALGGVCRPLARVVDRLPSLAAVAQLAGDALGGVVLTRGGRCLPVPGVPPHPLLTPGSAVLAVAREHASAPGAVASFLCPLGTGFVRLGVLDCRDEGTDHLAALVLVHPAGDLAGLDPPDLRLLGALLAGWDDERLRGACAVARVTERTAELAQRLDLPSAHALLVHVAREGLYLPPALWHLLPAPALGPGTGARPGPQSTGT